MTENHAIEGAISILANTMRLYVETHVRFAGLLNVDREEAINNLDRAFEAKLCTARGFWDTRLNPMPRRRVVEVGSHGTLLA
jgi:hypothetical protein